MGRVNEIVRITGTELLKDIGYDVVSFKSGIDAIEVFKEQFKTIDLIITDMIMPEINGTEIFYKLKEIDKSCKVILSSGFTRDEDLNGLKEA